MRYFLILFTLLSSITLRSQNLPNWFSGEHQVIKMINHYDLDTDTILFEKEYLNLDDLFEEYTQTYINGDDIEVYYEKVSYNIKYNPNSDSIFVDINSELLIDDISNLDESYISGYLINGELSKILIWKCIVHRDKEFIYIELYNGEGILNDVTVLSLN